MDRFISQFACHTYFPEVWWYISSKPSCFVGLINICGLLESFLRTFWKLYRIQTYHRALVGRSVRNPPLNFFVIQQYFQSSSRHFLCSKLNLALTFIYHALNLKGNMNQVLKYVWIFGTLSTFTAYYIARGSYIC